MINWKVRIKNKLFWMSIIPALILLIVQIASIFGVEINLSDLQEKLVSVVETVFAILSIIGIVSDPTTAGMSDSNLAMTYEEPKPRGF